MNRWHGYLPRLRTRHRQSYEAEYKVGEALEYDTRKTDGVITVYHRGVHELKVTPHNQQRPGADPEKKTTAAAVEHHHTNERAGQNAVTLTRPATPA